MANGVHGPFRNVTAFAEVIRGDQSESHIPLASDCDAEVIRGGDADSDYKKEESNR